MFGSVPIEFVGLGLLFGGACWSAVWAVKVLCHSMYVVSDLPD